MAHSSLRRIYELDRMIRNGILQSARQAAKHFSVSQRTIERDINELKAYFKAPIKYNRSKKCYEYTGEPVTLPAQWMNERELAILLIAERALRIFTGTSFEEEVHPAFNKFLDPIRHDKKMMQKIRDLCKSVIFFNPFGSFNDVHEKFSLILDAIMMNRCISMEYREINNEKMPRQQIAPYSLVSNANRWFVLGQCGKTDAVKAYALNMIYKPEIEEQTFQLPKDFNSQEYINKMLK